MLAFIVFIVLLGCFWRQLLMLVVGAFTFLGGLCAWIGWKVFRRSGHR